MRILDVLLAKRLWHDPEISLREIAVELGSSEKTLRRIARRYNWAPRKRYRTTVTEQTLPAVVTRRCEDCMGVYEGERNIANPVHVGCLKAQRAA
jgi:IS30 family transposase